MLASFFAMQGHIVTLLSYLLLGAACVVLIRLPRRAETLGARAGGGLFFFGCALTHTELMLHSGSDQLVDFDSLHHNLFVAMQEFGAPLFVLSILPYLPRILSHFRVEPRRDDDRA